MDMSPTRRDLLRYAPAAAGFLLAHELLARPASATPVAAPERADVLEPRIRSLRLLTAAPLSAMRDFYRDTIGFALVEEREREITFAAGASRLTFATARADQVQGSSGRGKGEPMYHFAFNILRDRIRAARVWQLERTPLVHPRPGLREPGWPDEIWHFRHWNAQSIFFFDPAFNIVEYIARHELPHAGAGAGSFSVADILYASEIGYVVDRERLPRATGLLSDKLGLAEYPRGADPWAMGDARGLLLCLARLGETWGEQSSTPVRWGVFPTECRVEGPKAARLELEGFPYIVNVA
jgi:catechol 2,3-dioxygenase-like lactoylglutathione lyase family enzyme